MTPSYVPAFSPADAVSTLNSGTSVNYPTILNPSTAPAAPKPFVMSHYICYQSMPAELLPPAPISIPATIWQSILNASVVEDLFDVTIYATDARPLLQQLVAATGSENTKLLRTLELEKDAAIADMVKCDNCIR